MIQHRIIMVLGMGLALTLILSLSFWRLWRAEQDSYRRVFQASESLNQELVTLRADNGQLVAQNQVLILKGNEVAAMLPGQAKEIRELGVRLKQAVAVSTTAFSVNTPATVFLRDSVIYDTVHVQLFDYQDGFFTLKGKSIGNQQYLDLNYRDTLVQVVYRGQRERPWLWIFSPRKLMQRVSLKNPNANINYTRQIDIIQ